MVEPAVDVVVDGSGITEGAGQASRQVGGVGGGVGQGVVALVEARTIDWPARAGRRDLTDGQEITQPSSGWTGAGCVGPDW